MTFNAYLLSLIGTILLCSIITVIIPNGKTASIIKGVTRLVCLLAIISPIPYFLQNEKGIFANDKNSNGIFSQTVIQTDDDFIKYYCQLRIRETERALTNELLEKFNAETEVVLTWVMDTDNGNYDTDKIKIVKITVTMQDKVSEEEQIKMSNYLTKNYCSEVQIE